VPDAGDDFIVLSDDKNAKQVSSHRIREQRFRDLTKTGKLSLEKLYETMQEGEIKELNLIIKTDVQGSIEALSDSLTKLSNDEVEINITHAATGTITESDVSLAAVSKAIIIGFNVRSSPKVQAYANEENVDIRHHKIIYNVIKEIKDAILGMMSSTFEEQILGRAEIREVFHIPKAGNVAGCYVTDGKVERGRPARVLRDGVICYDGKISSLYRFKDDVKEVQSGYECGIGIEKYNDIKVGDIIECYYLEEIKPELKE
jgi:translation initiation factor IF-2